MLEAKTLAGVTEGNGFVAGAVVRHDTLDRYPEAHIVGDSRLEEGDGTPRFLASHDLTEGDPGSVVDAEMHVLPARALATGALVALAGSIAGDAMADPVELAELFDVDMNQFTRLLALITPDRLGRLQRREPVEVAPGSEAAPARAGLASGGAIEIEFVAGARMRITGAVDAATLTAAVAALADGRPR